MKYRHYATYLITLVVAGILSCANPADSTNGQFTVTIKGTVTNKIFTALDSVQIITSNPFRRDSAKATGSFLISFTSSEKAAVNATVTFSRAGYYDTTRALAYSSTAKDIDLQAVVVRGVNSALDSTKTTKASQRPGTITFLGSSSDNLSILGAGGKDVTILSFEVRDSLGTPVDTANQLSVKFKFINRPDPQTQLNLDSAKTNSAGRVSVQLSSGLKSGIASLQASAAIKNKIDPTKYDTIKSKIVSIPIYGGFPDSAHFSLGSAKRNLPGAIIFGIHNKVSVIVGDTFGNPVQPGTKVLFSSTGGVIEGSAFTDNDGSASVDLITSNPVPPSGFAIIKAQLSTGKGTSTSNSNPPGLSKTKSHGGSIDEESVAAPKPLSNHSTKNTIATTLTGPLLTDSIAVLFSGRATVTSVDTGFNINIGSSKTINFTVSDPIGNPLSAGTTIKVTTAGAAASDVSVSGDVDVNIPDTQNRAYTLYKVSLKDIRTTGLNQSKSIFLTIEVAGDNGNAKLTLAGTLIGTGGVLVDSSIVASIVLVNPVADSIVVAGVGGVKSKDIVFKATNTFGLPAKNASLVFSFSKTLNGGEVLTPINATTDSGGFAKTTIKSGNGFGEVRVIATATRDSTTISSDAKVIYIYIPPSARLASQIFFAGATENDIFVAGVGGKENSTLTYEVRDSLGYPIDRNRRVFTTFSVQFFPNTFAQGGTAPVVIPSSDSTDDQGIVKTTVLSGTQAGTVQIVVNIQIPGRPLLVSQPVKISVHAGFADQKHFTIAAAQLNFPGLDRAFITDNITVQVADVYSNPVPQGTAVYFNSSHGTMQTGGGDAGLTDINGFVSKTWYSANPFPAPPDTLNGVQRGFARAYARTIGKDSARVLDSILILWTGAPIISKISGPANFAIANAGSAGPFTFTVVDRFGHPMSAGTTIVVDANAARIDGDANITMPDTQGSGAGVTLFTVSLSDADATNIAVPPATSLLTVTVTHPVYGTYKLVLASGTIQ